MRELHRTLLSAFPSRAALAQLVRYFLDRRLEEIAAGGNLSDSVFSLLMWAEAHGQIDRLVDGAQQENPGNPDLASFVASYRRPTAASASALQPGTMFDAGSRPTGSAQYPPELVEALRRGSLTLCIGSMTNFAQDSPAANLARLLAQRSAYPGLVEPISSAQAADVAQAYANERGMFNLVTLVREQAEHIEIMPELIGRAVALLAVETIVTTQWDDSLERFLGAAGRRSTVLVEDGDLPFVLKRSDGTNVVKLRGELKRPQSLVVTREQYETYFVMRPQIQRLLENLLVQTTLLYLGWDFSEPHFNMVAGQIGPRLGPLRRRSYAVVANPEPHQVRELQRRQIEVVYLPDGGEPLIDLAEWLSSLALQAA